MDAKFGRLRYASFLFTLIVLALILAARLIYFFMGDPQRFPINTVKITGSYQHISRKELESVMGKYLNASFFSIPVRQMHAELAALAWMKKVVIERVWPDTIKITLIEKIPVATWNNELVTAEGKLFHAGGEWHDAALPHLSGPANQQKEVLQVYEKMSKILSIYGLHAAALVWRENQAWDLTLTNGLQIRLGKRDLESRITRFCKAYPAVFADQSGQLASIDLRYPRGMAVQWKK